MRFGDRLRELREEKGITQKELGKIVYISDRVIGYYETNNRFPKDERTLNMLADYFNVSADYLLGRTTVRKPLCEYVSETGATYNLNIDGLPSEALKLVEEYIDLVRLKYPMKSK